MSSNPPPRRSGLRPSDGRPAFDEVVVTRMTRSPLGWEPEQALALLEQGYSPEQVATRTGFDVRWLRANQPD